MRETYWELCQRRLEWLKAAVPGLTRVGFLANPASVIYPFVLSETIVVAHQLGLDLEYVELRHPEDLEDAVSTLARRGAQALVVQSDPTFFRCRSRLAEVAAGRRLPAMYALTDYVDSGGLIAYGPSAADLSRRAAACLDQYQEGIDLDDVPPANSVRARLAVNLKAARALNLSIPPSILIQADQVVE